MIDKDLFKDTKILLYKLPETEQVKRYNYRLVGSGTNRHREPTDEVLGCFDSVLKLKPATNVQYQIVQGMCKDHKDWLHSLDFTDGVLTLVGAGQLARRILCLIY
jgi:hypothetical protein